jgi:Na+/proline symporter
LLFRCSIEAFEYKRHGLEARDTYEGNHSQLHVSSLDILVIVLYLLVTLGVGLYQALKIRTSGDYYAGGRKFNKFYLMMHALGTASHADEPVSVIGGAYERGLSGIWFTYLYLPLTPIFWLLAPYVRRTRFVTMADFFRARYDRSLAIFYSIVGVLKMSVAIGVALKGTATIFSSITGDAPGSRGETYAILVMTVVFVTYGFAGGLRATVVTETIQGPLIVLMSLLLLPFGLRMVGGFHGLHQSLSTEMFNLSVTQEFTPRWIFAASLTALIGWVAQPGLIAALGSGRTELEGRVGYTYGTMIKRFCAMGWVFTGIILAAMVAQNKLAPDEVSRLAHRESAFGLAVQRTFPHGMLGLMFAAIFASQMATLSAQMVHSSALASTNLYKGVIKRDASDAQVLAIGRVCGIFVVFLGVMLAHELASVADAITMLLQFTSIMGVVVWMGVLWRRANVAGAWAGVATLIILWSLFGPVGGLIHKLAPNHFPAWVGMYGPERFVFELMMCYLLPGIIVMVIVSLATQPQPTKQLDDFFMLLKTPVGQEQKLIDAGVPIVYTGNAQANSLEIMHPRLVHFGGFALAAIACALILGLLKILGGIGS